jgi:hypothetical protein
MKLRRASWREISDDRLELKKSSELAIRVMVLLHPLDLGREGAKNDAEVGIKSSRRVNGDSFIMVERSKVNIKVKRYEKAR